MFTGLTNALKGIGGEFEVQRVLGAIGTLAYIVAVPAFVMLKFVPAPSVTEFCLAYPGGLGVCIGATAGAIALKDRNTATSKIISETGAIPTKAPTGTQQVEVTNDQSNPVPTTTDKPEGEA